ncbi:ATP-binding protein [Actinacidiphila sp. bgisy144]|uniref:ATP-binding protein n=1 Tax=Actinacidiphila sp. bgisy144 TaxID=3413791 RepID=UPI003EB6FB2D
MTSGSRRSRLDLVCGPLAVGRAREHVRGVLAEWAAPETLAYDAVTVVVELAGNAVRHAGGRCALSMWVTNTRLHLGLWDQSPARPVLRPISYDAECGRGLRVVAGLSEGQWGTALTRPEGKVVWAALPLPAGYRRRIARVGSLPGQAHRRPHRHAPHQRKGATV